MGRTRKVYGAKRDGFVNFRIENDLTPRINALSFLLEKSVADLVQIALHELCDKYKSQIDLVVEAVEKAKTV